MRYWICGLLAVSVAVATPARAQTTIDPGMTRAEVVELLGKPQGERTAGSYNYLFYRNGCEERCGMQDLVILQNDLVVDAIFRSPRRVYSGESSSPNGVRPSASGGGSLRTRDTDQPITAPVRSSGAAGGARSGVVTGGADETPTAGATVGGAAVVRTPVQSGVRQTPAGSTTTGTPAGSTGAANTALGGANMSTSNPRGLDTTKVLDNIPPNPRDTNTIQPSRTQGQLTPSARDQAPIPYSGARPSPRDSAVKARTDTVKPPKE